MSTFEKSMENIFNTNPVEIEKPIVEQEKPIVPVPEVISKVSDDDLSYDLADAYKQTKDNLQDIIDQGKDAMEEILIIAKEGQHPRAFEVYSGLLKNVIDANKELLNVQKQMRDMEGKKEVNTTKIDKAVFVGTPAELNKLLKGTLDE